MPARHEERAGDQEREDPTPGDGCEDGRRTGLPEALGLGPVRDRRALRGQDAGGGTVLCAPPSRERGAPIRGQWNSMDASPAGVVTEPGQRKLPEVLVAVKAWLTYLRVDPSRFHTMFVAL